MRDYYLLRRAKGQQLAAETSAAAKGIVGDGALEAAVPDSSGTALGSLLQTAFGRSGGVTMSCTALGCCLTAARVNVKPPMR
jgi:hypothetical protein